MSEVVSIDYGPVRRHFPWVGLVNTGEQDLSTRYREIMAEARRDRKLFDIATVDFKFIGMGSQVSMTKPIRCIHSRLW